GGKAAVDGKAGGAVKFTHHFELDEEPRAAWARMADPQRLIPCIPGVTSSTAEGDGRYRFVLTTGLGPVRLTFEGNAEVSADDGARTLHTRVTMRDARSGHVHGSLHLQVEGAGDGARVNLTADVAIGGRLGEFAQPLLRRKAEQLAREFADNVRR